MHDANGSLPALPRCREELVLLRQDRPERGARFDVPAAPYDEALYRLRLRLAEPGAIFRDDPELVAESSPLFWDTGTPAQVLLTGLDQGGHWTLSLTRWGVVRWEHRPAGSAEPDAALESRQPLSVRTDVTEPFHLAVTLAGRRGRLRVRLMVASADSAEMAPLATLETDAPLAPLCSRVIVGEGPDGWRPASAETLELLVANSCLGALFQREAEPTGLSTDFPNGAALPGPRLDGRTASLYPAPELTSTGGNYWSFCRVDEPAIERVRIEKVNEMATRFFASPDRRTWVGLPVQPAEPGADGQARAYVQLPARTGPLYLANAPVYGEPERDADLADLAVLAERGLAVRELGLSRGGLPLHAVTLTDPDAPAAGKLGVVMICGQHSPVEQMTGYLGRPMLEELLRLNAEGPSAGLLRRLEVHWVPIFNIDTARLGLPGTTLDAKNPNRNWGEQAGPEQRAVQEFLLARRDAGVRMALLLDGHAGGGWRNHNVLTHYDMTQEQVDAPARELAGPDRIKAGWLALLDGHAGLREVWHSGGSAFPGNSNTWFQRTFTSPAMTLECGVVSQLDPDTRRTVPFTLEGFGELGRRLAHALAAGEELLGKAARKEYA